MNILNPLTATQPEQVSTYNESQHARNALLALHIPVLTTNATGQINFLNPAAEALLDCNAIIVTGRAVNELLQPRHAPAVKTTSMSPVMTGEYLYTRPNGTPLRIYCVVTPINTTSAEALGFVITLRDGAEPATMINQPAQHSLEQDALTRLLNRVGFEAALKELLERTKHETIWHSLCYLDLDNFKIINDTCGHAAGDALLQELTEVLHTQVRNSDVIARLGGDEFALLLENCPLDQAQKIGEKVRAKINDFRFSWQERTHAISASIGIVEIAPATANIAKILSTADVACFAAKELGRNRVHVYLESDDESARRHGEMQWYARITQAHAENRFTLYHQNIAPLNADSHSGEHFEILVRMVDEQGLLVPPGAFMPAAERYNLMPMIDRWVINQTFDSVKQRLAQGLSYPETIAINLSGASLGDNGLLDFIKQKFYEHAIPADIICFEITETAAISNLINAVKLIKALKALGCRFSLDDFGSGLSSFTYLKNMPIDYLKIDGSFVKDMLTDSINHAMVESINQIGHVMGIKTIAEFVETQELADRLKILGVDYAQGYGVHKPQPFLAKAVA
ncbi:MAG: EAL domain-containing protein [Gammaproteobacteria bacterium]|nr:EAL domain-containing protein [Gammaproteobacteria bacterium]